MSRLRIEGVADAKVYPSFSLAENTDDLLVGKTLFHGDVLMWLMKTLLTSGCTNQRSAGQQVSRSAGQPGNFCSDRID
ncbi:hypothetical protein BSR00_14925 [Serratia liquefaciens]|nr:hypothetical protein BSR00_14925 [Serratia liquefaciens]RYM82151.1 hypothetical protein BSR01_03410 [Serratia liquefaciens]